METIVLALGPDSQAEDLFVEETDEVGLAAVKP